MVLNCILVGCPCINTTGEFTVILVIIRKLITRNRLIASFFLPKGSSVRPLDWFAEILINRAGIPRMNKHLSPACRSNHMHMRFRWKKTCSATLRPYVKQEALTAAFCLACLDIRSRNEEAINSTRNMIYSLKVFYFLLYRVRYFYWFSARVSYDRKYVCGRRLYACINTRKFKGLDSREMTSLPVIKKVIYMARHFNHRR